MFLQPPICYIFFILSRCTGGLFVQMILAQEFHCVLNAVSYTESERRRALIDNIHHNNVIFIKSYALIVSLDETVFMCFTESRVCLRGTLLESKCR